jgi:hypothetical protein
MTSDGQTFYVFANTSDVMCWHNLHFTKSLLSSGFVAACEDQAFRDAYTSGTAVYAPFVPNQTRSSGFISRFSTNVTAHYQVEYDAERTRAMLFPFAPSRFSCIYAFGREEDCNKAHQLYGWRLDTVRRFTLVPHALNRVQKANMEIISLMRATYPLASRSESDREGIWRHYWSGRGALTVDVPVIRDDAPSRESGSCNEIWEYLIEGHLQLVD